MQRIRCPETRDVRVPASGDMRSISVSNNLDIMEAPLLMAANIAEGNSRFVDLNRKTFFGIARGLFRKACLVRALGLESPDVASRSLDTVRVRILQEES